MKKIIFISLLLMSYLNASGYDKKELLLHNQNINKCVLVIKKQEYILNEYYSKNYKYFTKDEYESYLEEKRKIFLKKAICYEREIKKI